MSTPITYPRPHPLDEVAAAYRNAKISLPGCSRCKELEAERDELREQLDALDTANRDLQAHGVGLLLKNAEATVALDELRAELATARALLADYQGVANRLRAEIAALRYAPGVYSCGCRVVKVTDIIRGYCPTHIKPLAPRPPSPYVCPYCQRPVTDLQYHESPADCERERNRDQPGRLVDDTDPKG